MQSNRSNPRNFFLGFLAVFSLCSLLFNVVLVLHISHPSFWHDLRLSRLHPPQVRANDHIRGSSNAPVTIIEYSDFQCPFCRVMHTSLQKAVAEGKIRWVYREYPLSSIHPSAFKEAEAAECAGAQGKFWEFSDSLFDAQAQIESSKAFDLELASIASQVHADPAKMQECLHSGQFSEVIKNEINEAKSLQIEATPTVFIDNQRHEGAMSYDDLKIWLAYHGT